MLTKQLWQLAQIGAEWVLALLLVLSLASVMLMVERFLHFMLNRAKVEKLEELLRRALAQGGAGLALRAFQNIKGSEAAVMRDALSVSSRGPAAVEEIAIAARGRERLRMERGLAILGTLGNNAPFIGLFGTVLGIINAFRDLAQTEFQAGGAKVMGGISEALVATAVGLLVAIPAVATFNFFQRQVKRVLTQSDTLVHFLLSHLRAEPETPAPERPEQSEERVEYIPVDEGSGDGGSG